MLNLVLNGIRPLLVLNFWNINHALNYQYLNSISGKLAFFLWYSFLINFFLWYSCLGIKKRKESWVDIYELKTLYCSYNCIWKQFHNIQINIPDVNVFVLPRLYMRFLKKKGLMIFGYFFPNKRFFLILGTVTTNN